MKPQNPIKVSRREVLGLGIAGLMATRFSTVQASEPMIKTTAKIVIIGAGAGGITLANRLIKKLHGAKISILDPRSEHWYQPGLSLVGAGLKPANYVVSSISDWLPRDLDFIQEAAIEIDPIARTVTSSSNKKISYDYLVLAPGLSLDYESIDGFSLDLVGKDGIGSLYAGPNYAAKTWQAASRFIEQGGIALSTRPDTEMKCAGAPLKHTFLIDDLASRGPKSNNFEMHYLCPQKALFSVPIVAEKTRMLFEQRNIHSHYGYTLKSINPGKRIATFAVQSDSATTKQNELIELPYDYLHIIPPQRAPQVIRDSGLSWHDKWLDQGWVACDQKTLRQLNYPEIFALGDVAGVPKGKTAASVKWQAPVVADQIISDISGQKPTLIYDGYTSCPLITKEGQAMLVEFDYHNNLLPSFPGVISPLEELWISWLMKVWALKPTYNAMLRGKA